MTENAVSESPFKPGVPMGGSELILANLRRALPEFFPVFDDPSQDKVQVIVSRPQQFTLDPKKPKILWLQDLPNDPNSQVLADATYRSQFNRIVCVSHWQQQQYAAMLRIPFSEMIVIKNAVPAMETPVVKPASDKLRFIYTSTPHRGLGILAGVVDALVKERQDWELHVYSSFQIYGWHDADKQEYLQNLYAQLRANPCVVYHGSRPNAEVRQAVRDAHVFIYPSIYMETSCMAMQEAMMAGCLAITTNLGALPETGAEWAWYIQVDESAEVLAGRTHAFMRHALDTYDSENVRRTLLQQSMYYRQFWSFEDRVPLWREVLASTLDEGPREEMLVLE